MNVTIISCFDVYDNRAELLQKSLCAWGHQVTVLIPNFRHMQKCVRRHCPEGFEMLPAVPYYSKFSPVRIRSHILFSRDALERAQSLRPDMLWVLAPPNSLVKEAAQYKKQHPKTRLVFDFLDLWPESMPVPGFGATPFAMAWRGLRDRYVDAADTVVAECGQYWTVLRKCCDERKLHTLYIPRNPGFRPLKERPPSDRLALCFLGRVNRDVDIRAIGTLIRRLDRPVELHIIGAGPQEPQLRQAAEDAGAAVISHGRVYGQREKEKIFDRCHFGLNLLRGTGRGGLSMKSVDYLEASLPVINNVRGDMWEFIEAHPVGINYEEGMRITVSGLLGLQIRREQIRALYDTYFAERAFSVNLQKIIGK